MWVYIKKKCVVAVMRTNCRDFELIFFLLSNQRLSCEPRPALLYATDDVFSLVCLFFSPMLVEGGPEEHLERKAHTPTRALTLLYRCTNQRAPPCEIRRACAGDHITCAKSFFYPLYAWFARCFLSKPLRVLESVLSSLLTEKRCRINSGGARSGPPLSAVHRL